MGDVSALRTSRREAGKTLEDFARAVGLTRASLSRIETGLQRPSTRVVEELVKLTGLRPEQIDPLLKGIVAPKSDIVRRKAS